MAQTWLSNSSFTDLSSLKLFLIETGTSSSPPSSTLTVTLEAALGPVDVRRMDNWCSDRAEVVFESLEATDGTRATQHVRKIRIRDSRQGS
jgi:hypothetical protein